MSAHLQRLPQWRGLRAHDCRVRTRSGRGQKHATRWETYSSPGGGFHRLERY